MKLRENINSLTLRVEVILLFSLLLVGSDPSFGAEPFTIICDGKATGISADGSVVVGVTNDTHETWRWTNKSGRVLLGLTSRAANRNDWCTPDISDDGRVVSATIPSSDSHSETLALWYEKAGWLTPADSGFSEANRRKLACGARGLSGDGSTAVGQIRISENTTVAVAWKPAGQIVRLGKLGPNSRANDSNIDGSVIVGWSEHPTTGIWQPTVWDERGAVMLASTKAFCEASAVSASGVIIVGQAYDESRDLRVAALWLDSDFGWVQETLGALPGTVAGYGQAMALDLTDNGHTIVGFNNFNPDRSAGFIWTLEDGLVDVHDLLAGHGVDLPEGFRIDSVTGISIDGEYMTGFGEDTTFWPHQTRSFLINVKAFPKDKSRQKILPAGTGISNPFKTKELE